MNFKKINFYSENIKKNRQSNLYYSFNRYIPFYLIVMIILLIFNNFCFASTISPITNIWYKTHFDHTQITIKGSNPIENYHTMYLEDPLRLVVDIDNAIHRIDGFANNILKLNVGTIKQVRFGQFETGVVRFVFDLYQKSKYEINLENNKKLLIVKIYNKNENKDNIGIFEDIYSVNQQTILMPTKEDIKMEREKPSLVESVKIPITLNFKEVEIVDALRSLSEISGINIIIDDSVQGSISLNLENVAFKEALDWLLRPKKLSYAEVGNAIIVGEKSIILEYEEKVTKIVKLKNAKADNLKTVLDNYIGQDIKSTFIADTRLNTIIVECPETEINRITQLIFQLDAELATETFKIDNAIFENEIEGIKNMLKIIIPDEERIIIDKRQNKIIVKGSTEEIENAATMIEGLDKRAPQIMIDAKIVEITLDGEKHLGIRWFSGGMDDGNEGSMTLGELTLGDSFERQGLISARLKALETENKVNILSNPKILTLDGKPSVIDSGKQIPIQEEIVDDEGNIRQTVTWKDVGVKLEITPRLSSDGYVNMELFTEVKSLGEEFIVGYPVINNRSETGFIRAKSGETKVIGGLISTEEKENIRKIPILSEIPIFGEIFKFRNKTKKRTEVIVLITANKIEY